MRQERLKQINQAVLGMENQLQVPLKTAQRRARELYQQGRAWRVSGGYVIDAGPLKRAK